MATEDVTHLVERLEAFENRLGVGLEGLYAAQDMEYGNLRMNGELHPREGTEIDDDLDIVVALYDAGGRVIGVATEWIDSENFFGFEAFSVRLRDVVTPPAKVRVYPKAT